jgi:spore coat-associated protein N
MSRLAVLRRHPKRTIAGLTVALVAVGVAVGSGASFTSSSTNNPSTSFTAGTLKQDLGTPSGTLSFNGVITNIKPGFGTPSGTGSTADTAATSGPGYGAVTVTNSGSLTNKFTVAGSVPTHAAGTDTVACGGACSDLQTALKVTLFKQDTGDASPVQVYDGLVSGLSAATALGGVDNTFTLAASGTRTYTAHFYLPSATGNAFQGGSATVNVTFTGAQTSTNETAGP